MEGNSTFKRTIIVSLAFFPPFLWGSRNFRVLSNAKQCEWDKDLLAS